VVELLATGAVVVLAMLAEALHLARLRRVSALAFGPAKRPALWARLAPLMRIAALGGLTWGLATLLLLDPKIHRASDEIPEREMRHLLIVLDVSPSMRLVDAGADGKQSRRQRARELIESLFARVAIRQHLITVVAVYNGAIPVVEKTRDPEVVHNILDELPMEYAFRSGGTDLFAGLEEAARISRPWRPGSATLLLVSDGDTVAATDMPKMPASIVHTLVLGVGDSQKGSFIDGKQSRQEASTLRQIAARLHGVYHDGNVKHIATDVIQAISQSGETSSLDRLSRREYALLACTAGGILLAFLPLALQRFGTRWTPGTKASSSSGNPRPREQRTRDQRMGDQHRERPRETIEVGA